MRPSSPSRARLGHETPCTHAHVSVKSARRVVYSTCSINQQENEDVVEHILKEHPSWKLAKALPEWPNRGRSSTLRNAEYCVRVRVSDGSGGFFVAVLENQQVTVPDITKQQTADVSQSSTAKERMETDPIENSYNNLPEDSANSREYGHTKPGNMGNTCKQDDVMGTENQSSHSGNVVLLPRLRNLHSKQKNAGAKIRMSPLWNRWFMRVNRISKPGWEKARRIVLRKSLAKLAMKYNLEL